MIVQVKHFVYVAYIIWNIITFITIDWDMFETGPTVYRLAQVFTWVIDVAIIAIYLINNWDNNLFEI